MQGHNLRFEVRIAAAAAALLVGAGACRGPQRPRATGPEASSLLGERLQRPALEAELAEAQAELAARPDSEEAAIWVGRRHAYLGEYREAVEVFSAALERHPGSVALLRHRGHRYITLRRLDRAVEDLTLAEARMRGLPDAVEPDGAPNALGVPRSTLRTNVYYHLALAHYLRGDFARAAAAWRACSEAATNDDMRVAADYWLWLSSRRAGLEELAEDVLARSPRLTDVLENHDYRRLLRFFRGDLSEKDLLLPLEPGSVSHATTLYGFGAWKLLEGEPERALAIFETVTRHGFWPAFGHIAAEAELAR